MTAAATMKLGSLVPWLGGKRTLAPDIVVELGEHQAYDSPCCGSLAVLFAKPPCATETVNDLHGDLINVAMCVASQHWRALYEAVDRICLCETFLSAFQEDLANDYDPPADPRHVADQDIERAARHLALSWIARNGVSGTERVNYQIAVRWTQGGGSPGIRWRAAVDSVPAWHDRLKGVVILRRDLFKIVPKLADEPGRAIYLDPPYFKTTRGSAAGSRYLYDFDESADLLFGREDQHARLARELQRFTRARVVVSYYDDPRLDELYPAQRWTKRLVYRNKNLAAQNHRGANKTVAPEVLLMNGPSFAKEPA